MPEKPVPASPALHEWRRIVTVTGPVAPEEMGLTDAHNHAWIARVPGAAADAPVLDDFPTALQELAYYRQAGGRALVDCQPPFCGRDALSLARLSRESGVILVACTGFHLRRYYPPEIPLWELSSQAACDLFADELLHGTRESLNSREPVFAGFIKIACESSLDLSPLRLLEGAAQAARQTGAAIEIHTEKGAAAEEILDFFSHQGLSPYRLVLCHMDKRPDFGLHRELAEEGALLEYDTFFRPKYDPEENLWPLIDQMLQDGYAGNLAFATDLADPSLWQTGGGPGLAGLPLQVRMRLRGRGFDSHTVRAVMGSNIAGRLARVS